MDSCVTGTNDYVRFECGNTMRVERRRKKRFFLHNSSSKFNGYKEMSDSQCVSDIEKSSDAIQLLFNL